MCFSTLVYPFPHFPGPTRARRGETEAPGWTFCLANRHLSDQTSKLQRGFGKRHFFPCQSDNHLSGCSYQDFMDWLRLNVLEQGWCLLNLRTCWWVLVPWSELCWTSAQRCCLDWTLEDSTRCKYRLVRGGNQTVFGANLTTHILAWTWTWHRFRSVSCSCDLEQTSPLGENIFAFSQGFSHLTTKPWPRRNRTLKARTLTILKSTFVKPLLPTIQRRTYHHEYSWQCNLKQNLRC